MGEAMLKSGLVANVSFENLSGGGGGRAIARLIETAPAGILNGESQVLSTGLSEAIDMARAGEVRILAVTAASRLKDAPDIPTLKELGYDLEFANWRGFFAAWGIP